MYSSRVSFAYEFERRLRVALVGCGGQAFRNLLPCLQYAPLELIATCDVDRARADFYARQFGARRSYMHYPQMLEQEDLEAVLLATGYDSEGRPLYPAQAAQHREGRRDTSAA